MTTRAAEDQATNEYWEKFVGVDDLIIVDGELYVDVEGQRYAYWYWVEMKDGSGRKLMNLECKGAIPEDFRSVLPDNADFLYLNKDERDKKPTWQGTTGAGLHEEKAVLASSNSQSPTRADAHVAENPHPASTLLLSRNE